MSEWSNLAEEVKAHRSRPGPVCSVKRMLESLAPEDRVQVVEALANPAYSTTGLAKTFRSKLGNEAPSMFTVGNHRREQCGCTR